MKITRRKITRMINLLATKWTVSVKSEFKSFVDKSTDVIV
jgi:hypothetical protein